MENPPRLMARCKRRQLHPNCLTNGGTARAIRARPRLYLASLEFVSFAPSAWRDEGLAMVAVRRALLVQLTVLLIFCGVLFGLSRLFPVADILADIDQALDKAVGKINKAKNG